MKEECGVARNEKKNGKIRGGKGFANGLTLQKPVYLRFVRCRRLGRGRG